MSGSSVTKASGSIVKQGLKEIRFLFCVENEASAGLRSFVKKNYTDLKLKNKELPLLVRYGKNTEARIIATYPRLERKTVNVENMTADQIQKVFTELAQ